MKKFLITAAVAAVLFSCGGGEKKEETAATEPAKEEAKPEANPLEDKALALIAGSGCATCHKINEKINGPAYMDVANKYENTQANVDMLVEKVLKGGKGVWGEVPMPANVAITKEDATTIVQYVLSLKK